MRLLLLILVFIASVRTFAPNTENSVTEGYNLVSMKKKNNGYVGNLEISGQGPHLYGNDFGQLVVDVTFETDSRVHVQITDLNNSRWKVPYITNNGNGALNPSYDFSYTSNPFGFAVTRKEDGAVLFNTSTDMKTFNGIVFEDPYIEISTWLPEGHAIYGLGERIDSFRVKPQNTYTIWNMDNGNNEHVNLYGTYPFHLEMRPNGYGHGVLLLNSNAMDIYVGDNFMTYKTIGGCLDFYIFSGGSEPNVVPAQLTELVGRPYFPPYWVLGFHQCKWGYKNVEELETVVSKYREVGIPLETMWSDIDYMDGYRDFTVDPNNFPADKMQSFIGDLHSKGQKFVPIVDPGIMIDSGYEPYDTLIAKKLYIKDKTGAPLKGKVWPGYTVFPDFTNSDTFSYWTDEIIKFHDTLPFDGLWIDMNELANFCDGSCSSQREEREIDFIHGMEEMSFDPDNPPYVPGSQKLYHHTIFPSAIHNLSIEYNVHSLYGYLEQKATRLALEKLFASKRVFSLSRSTFVGSSHNGYHWLGDNESTFKSMRSSVTSIMAMSLFGQPIVGADICGFNGETTKELCMRWLELGAFYPFSRNHNSVNMKSQEFYQFGQDMIDVAKKMYNIRYSLLTYYYTQLYFATSRGDSLIQPLFFIFSKDSETLDIENQFFVGDSVMVAPVLDEGKTSIDVYLPDANWYDLYTYEVVSESQKGYTKTFDAEVDHIVALYKGGSVIPWQEPGMTTEETMQGDFELIVAPDENGEALGTLYLDDGETVSTTAYSLVDFSLSTQGGTSKLASSIVTAQYAKADDIHVTDVKVLGSSQVSEIEVNGKAYSSYSYDATTKVLKISNLQLSVMSPFTITWN